MGSSWPSGSPPVGSSQALASVGHASSGAGFLRTMQISVATR